MKKIIILFIVLLISVWIGLQLQAMSGYILISYKDYNIQTTLWLGIFIAILGFLAFYIVLRFCSMLIAIPKKVRKLAKIRREHRIFRKTLQGLHYLIHGSWRKAQKILQKTSNKANTNLATIDYLGAAYAAQKQGLYLVRDNYLDAAKQKNCKEIETIDLFTAQLLIANQEWDKALLLLRGLYKQNTNCPLTIKLLQKVYLYFHDWKHLFYLLPNLQSAKILAKNDFLELQKQIYLGLLQDYIAADTYEKAIYFWKQMPRRLKNDPTLLLTYLTYLQQSAKAKDHILIEKTLEHKLKKTFDEKLINFYCSIKSHKPIKQLKIVEHWVGEYETNPALLSSLGRLCQNLMLWGKAKHYLEKALQLEPTIKIFYELGLAMEKQGNRDAAYNYYREALKLYDQKQ